MNIKKIAIGVLFLARTSFAYAEEEKVEVTSFRYADSRTRVAELCGKLLGVTSFPAFVKIVVDEKSDNPGIYNSVVGPEAKFCTTVVTYYGTASVFLWGQTKSPVTFHVETEYPHRRF